ncbi:PIG-L deacetylase family protein [Tenacibaculum maritimum]|uniref:PIG-L deacetylase family protein n=1 Tax=Tenacibaculum maritimum TaxID=107401 RepID=UPI0012E56184|nr:PIG-L deacetylase family protein [Tenacibaculum maritimum]MCD9581674.1 PIG-L family deacetylase [Tenacibaculum maritimum]MCD9636200.1 PIG-L family deacetylase [Tenacibaculum maritimum]MDB0601497.1 PIG-L family deacetylase [Tenacibaculum maritimum]MDB0612954.1 PIG-L family deacetylase [Tenacibaculum maritimum]CAA0189666.1 Carbohydrate esterase, family CE14 [Tenacibaculum maritimum]
MFKKIQKVLVLAPHTDDGEFGCGGTIAKLVRQGVEVHYVAFSACEQSVLPQYPSNILITEVKEATKVLGIKRENLHLLKYNVRTFNYNRQEILDDIIGFKKSIDPDLIFIPSLNDIHQDHATIANEAVRAFKFANILSYEMPWNNFNFATTNFFILNEDDIKTKIEALRKYKSQEHRPYANEEFIRSLARIRGVQIGKQYAEVFEVIRLIN